MLLGVQDHQEVSYQFVKLFIGSTTANKDFEKTERARDVSYRDYRSNFLIIWLILNIGTAITVTHYSRDNPQFAILTLGIFLTSIVAIKVGFSIYFNICSWCKDNKFSKAKSKFFARAKEVLKHRSTKSFRFEVVFRKHAPYSTEIIKAGERMIQNVYKNSLSDPSGEIDFGINLTRINKLIEAHRVAYDEFIKGGRGPNSANFIPFHAPNMTNCKLALNFTFFLFNFKPIALLTINSNPSECNTFHF